MCARLLMLFGFEPADGSILAAQMPQLVRYGLLAFGSEPFATELGRLGFFLNPLVDEIASDFHFLGHFPDRFAVTNQINGLGFEFFGVSLARH